MRLIKTAGLTAMFVSFITLAGCGGAVGYYAGVGYGPPAPLVEEPIGVAPGPDYVWAPGYYDWEGGAWAWRRGSWRRRPHPEDRWVSPRWEHSGNRYVYREGGWQHGERFHH